MNTKKTKIIDFPNVEFNNEDLDNVIMLNPIEFLSQEDNERIIENLIQSLKDFKEPDKWMTWEESNRILTEKYFNGNV